MYEGSKTYSRGGLAGGKLVKAARVHGIGKTDGTVGVGEETTTSHALGR